MMSLIACRSQNRDASWWGRPNEEASKMAEDQQMARKHS
jgi:hypothetical protein